MILSGFRIKKNMIGMRKLSDKYILKDHTPILEPDLTKWLKWFETANRRVDETFITNNITKEKIRVSTVFLGLNHNYIQEEPPLLFETMIFGGKFDEEEYQTRCSTWKEAEKMHQKAIDVVSAINLIEGKKTT